MTPLTARIQIVLCLVFFGWELWSGMRSTDRVTDSVYAESAYGDYGEQRLSDHSMDGLIPDAADYAHVHLANATLPAQDGEEEGEEERSGGGASFQRLPSVFEKPPQYSTNLVPGMMAPTLLATTTANGGPFGALTAISLQEEGEERDRNRGYSTGAIPSNVGHDVAAIARLKDAPQALAYAQQLEHKKLQDQQALLRAPQQGTPQQQQGEHTDQLPQDDINDVDSIQLNTNDMAPNDEQSTIDVDAQTDELQTPPQRRRLTHTHQQQQQQQQHADRQYLRRQEQHSFI